MPDVLLAEEDPNALVFLADNLAADGYTVHAAANRDEAIATLRGRAVDAIVVDVNGQTLGLLDWLRDASGEAILAAADTPMLVLSSNGDEVRRIRLLERGADDVIEKPYSYLELRARLGAVLRRTSPRQQPPVLHVGRLRIDRRMRTVTIANQPIALAHLEYRLLCRLASDPGRVFTRQELLRDVWGYRAKGQTRTLDTHACRVRGKLVAGGAERMIVGVWGVGYRLAANETEPSPKPNMGA